MKGRTVIFIFCMIISSTSIANEAPTRALSASLLDIRQAVSEFRSCLGATGVKKAENSDKLCGAAVAALPGELPLFAECMGGEPIAIQLLGSVEGGEADRVFLDFKCGPGKVILVSLRRLGSKYSVDNVGFIVA